MYNSSAVPKVSRVWRFCLVLWVMGVLFVSLGAILFGTTYLVGETHIIGVTTKKKTPPKIQRSGIRNTGR